MELSTFAYTIGVVELLFGLPLLFYTKHTVKWLEKAFKDDVQMRVLGAFMAILGTLVLVEDNVVSLDPRGLVVLMAWMVFLKGLIYSWWPHTATKMRKSFMKNEAALTLGGTAATAIGLLLFYAGMILS